MRLADPSVLETPSEEPMMATMTTPPEAAASVHDDAEIDMMDDTVAMDATNSGDDADQKRSGGAGGRGGGGGGNRWPRQETFALLKIRSDMDAAFRDSSLKGPLWEQVSRKMAELGYNRGAKKCKEKFENVYKYHKRTKESRSGKPEGKNYKFFDQLQALENYTLVSPPNKPPPPLSPPPPSQPQPSFQTLPTNIINNNDPTTATISYVTTVPSILNPTLVFPPPPSPTTTNVVAATITNPRNLSNKSLFSSITTMSTSSSTASDEDMEQKYRKKRKMKNYFRRLTRQVLAKQEEMQKRFLEAIEKREREREAQLEAWRAQEMARINREHDILVQERSTAAAKDAAVIAFLQKLSGGGQQNPAPPPPPPPAPPLTAMQVGDQPPHQQLQLMPIGNKLEMQKLNINNGHNNPESVPNSSSRWPKAEIHALIRLRTSMDPKYQENGPKGPLWEDISAGMQRLGYNRSAKRCKEKWENINKYFKKVRESNKHRREDSKTCPYFHELDALYKEKSKTHNTGIVFGATGNQRHEMMMEPLMVQPEQQWRPPTPHVEDHQEGGAAAARENNANDMFPCEANEREGDKEDDEMEEEDSDDDLVVEDEDSEEEDDHHQEGRYEVAATNNKLASVDTVE